MTDIQPDPIDTPIIDPNEHAKLALENALLRAGVDLDSPQGQLVQDAWAGKVPVVESIKTQWELVRPVVPEPEPVPPAGAEPARIDGEAGQANERRELNSNSVVEPNPEDRDPRQAAIQAGLDVMNPPRESGRNPGTNEDALAAVFHTLVDAAQRGDQRVLVGYEQPQN